MWNDDFVIAQCCIIDWMNSGAHILASTAVKLKSFNHIYQHFLHLPFPTECSVNNADQELERITDYRFLCIFYMLGFLSPLISCDKNVTPNYNYSKIFKIFQIVLLAALSDAPDLMCSI